MPSFATAAVTDVVNALSTATGVPASLGLGAGPTQTGGDNDAADQMCNLRAVPANTLPAATSTFAARPVGFGYLEGESAGRGRQDYRSVANNVNGRWEMTSAGGSRTDAFDSPGPYDNADGLGGWGDDGLAGAQLFRGSNFNENSDSIIDEVAFLTADEQDGPGVGGAGIAVDGHRGRLSDEDHQLNVLEGASHVDVTRTVNALTGDVTVTERQPVIQCRDTDRAFPSILDCWILGGDYADSGVDLTRTYRTSNGGQTVTITDVWRNHTLDEMLPLSLEYENDIEGGSAVGFGSGAIERRDPGDSPSLPSSGAFSMILDGDASEPENGDSADDGAVTYRTVPTEILFSDEDEWIARYGNRVLSPGQSLSVTQVWNQVDTLSAAAAAAAAAASGGADAGGGTSGGGGPVNVITIVATVREIVVGDAPVAAPAGTASTPAVTQQPTASSARSCTVPRLRGRTRLAAERALVRAGCAIGRVSRRASRALRAGRVLRQSRSAGAVVPAGTNVALTVARKRR